ncbi:tripartite tricarboxylate transporter substrate binding protein [soil metagenome]
MQTMNQARTLTVALVLTAAVAAANAAPYPTKPVTIVMPYQAGGSGDVIARPLAEKLGRMWGQPVIVDNRPGANGVIATEFAAKAPADGYTLLYHITGIIQNPSLYKNVRYDPFKDFDPLMQIGGQAMGVSVPANSPYKTVDQLLQSAVGKSGGLTYGSIGFGMTGQIYSELLTKGRSMPATHVPYKGQPAMVVDLVADRMDMALLSAAEASLRAKSNAVRVLAVTGTERVAQMPDVPTLKELGYKGFEMVGWHGLFAPAGTPADVEAKITADVATVLKDPEIVKLLADQAINVTANGPKEFSKIMRNDYEQWGALIRKFDIRID